MDSTLTKGLNVLAWLAHQKRACGVFEVASALNLARSNAHRTLQTLVAGGWAIQEPSTSAYRASLLMLELGSLVARSNDIQPLLHPLLAQLAQLTGETIHLAALDGADIVYIDKFDSPLPVAAYSRIGGRAPAHCVASGKALLAAMHCDEGVLQARLGTLQAHTENSITTYPALTKELAQCNTRGYAVNREEWRLGVCGLGVTVFDARGEPVAAVGMSVPSIRFAHTQSKKLVAAITQCGHAASAVLGYRRAQQIAP